MSHELAISRDESQLPVTLQIRIKHGLLQKAVRKLGSQAALARYLDVRPQEVGAWCNLKRMPSRNNPCWDEWNDKLLVLIGHDLEEIFPARFREDDLFLQTDKRLELSDRIIHREGVAQQIELITGEELRQRMDRALEGLPYREREVLKLRYGLGDGFTYTLDECAKIFRVTRERIRQVEARGLRRLQDHADKYGLKESGENE